MKSIYLLIIFVCYMLFFSEVYAKEKGCILPKGTPICLRAKHINQYIKGDDQLKQHLIKDKKCGLSPVKLNYSLIPNDFLQGIYGYHSVKIYFKDKVYTSYVPSEYIE